MNQAAKSWTKTQIENVYRNPSGVYYARVTMGGKRTWRSLGADVLSIARTEFRKLHHELAT
jgi:hypothetical protein